MSLSEQIKSELDVIQANVPKVYDKGFKDGVTSTEEEKGTMNIKYVNRIAHLFNGVRFSDVQKIVIDAYDELSECNYAFGNCEGTLKTVVINAPNNTDITSVSFQNCFSNNEVIEEVDLSGMDTYEGIVITTQGFNAMFNFASSLKTIKGRLNPYNAQNYQYAFNQCSALEDVEFISGSIYPSWNSGISFLRCSKLTDKSIQSIIDGLCDLTGETAQKLSLHTNVINKLTDEQKVQILSKNWTVG